MKRFSDGGFSFFHGQLLLIFHVLFWFRVTFKQGIQGYFEWYIRDHLSGTKVRIWIGSEDHVVFNFSCIFSCNLTKTFTFFCMSLLSLESGSEILLFKVFINACKMTGEIPIDWSFFLAVWHSVNSLSKPLTAWNLSWSSIH